MTTPLDLRARSARPSHSERGEEAQLRLCRVEERGSAPLER